MGNSTTHHLSVIRIAAGALVTILFGIILFMSFAETRAIAQIVEGEDGRVTGIDSQPLKCRSIMAPAIHHDKAFKDYDEYVEFTPSLGDDFTDVARVCADARTRQGFRIVVLAIPTLLLGVVAVTPRRRIREDS